ncbi:MAG: outer membrane beta-barrel protein [Candidatus Limimorpha sp.]
MKKIISIIAIAITLFSGIKTEAQIFLGEAFVGANICQVDGDMIMGYFKPGINVGLGVITPVWQKDNFSLDLSLEVVFNQKGAKQGVKYKDGVVDENGNILTGEYNLSMNYGEVPFMVYFTDKKFASAGVGISYARLMKVKEYEHGLPTNVTATSGEFDQNEYNILADVKIRVYKRLKFGFRYSYSLNSIRTREFFDLQGNSLGEKKQYNNLFTFRLTYVFNERLEDLVREEYRYTGDNPKFHDMEVEKQLKKLRRQQQREGKKKK